MLDAHQPRFADRHIGPDSDAVAVMLDTIGVATLDDLAAKALPANILDALSADGVAPGLESLPAPRPRPRRWPNCARWPSRTPSRCR